MNIVEMYRKALQIRNEYSHEQCEEVFKNLLGKFTVEIDNLLAANVKDYERGDVFYMIQRVIACLIMADNEHLKGEYDGYVQYCAWAGFRPLSPEQLTQLDRDTSMEQLVDIAKFIISARSGIEEEAYQCFVLSLMFMSLLGDHEIDENEYNFIRWFFHPEQEHAPEWEQFKKEF